MSASAGPKWKPGKHCVWPKPEYEDLSNMLPKYACQVLGPRCAGTPCQGVAPGRQWQLGI
eukprot:1145517-Pelagomonas_calceolata.AAC.1